MMNWFTQYRMYQSRVLRSLASFASRRQAASRACLNSGAIAFRDRIEQAKVGLTRWGAPAELKAATASGGEIFMDADFSAAGLSNTGLSNWRSQGQWKDSANRQRNYWTASTAPAEIIWKMVIDLANFASWHPLISSTNAPYGQTAKPGLIYRVCSRYFPLSMQVFVERVQPGELLSIRLFPFPGLQERVTYRIVSTICGTCVLYSITLSGWLSPLAWPMMKPHAVKVAAALVQAAEQETLRPSGTRQRLARYNQQSDIF